MSVIHIVSYCCLKFPLWQRAGKLGRGEFFLSLLTALTHLCLCVRPAWSCEWLYEHFVPIGGQFDQNLVTQLKKKVLSDTVGEMYHSFLQKRHIKWKRGCGLNLKWQWIWYVADIKFKINLISYQTTSFVEDVDESHHHPWVQLLISVLVELLEKSNQ